MTWWLALILLACIWFNVMRVARRKLKESLDVESRALIKAMKAKEDIESRNEVD